MAMVFSGMYPHFKKCGKTSKVILCDVESLRRTWGQEKTMKGKWIYQSNSVFWLIDFTSCSMLPLPLFIFVLLALSLNISLPSGQFEPAASCFCLSSSDGLLKASKDIVKTLYWGLWVSATHFMNNVVLAHLSGNLLTSSQKKKREKNRITTLRLNSSTHQSSCCFCAMMLKNSQNIFLQNMDVTVKLTFDFLDIKYQHEWIVE